MSRPRVFVGDHPDHRTPENEMPRILVVEDNELVRDFACFQLRGLGYEVLTAEHGSAALAIVESGEALDLMFTDIVMPGGMSGLELAAHVHGLRPDLPVLLTSGCADRHLVSSTQRAYTVLAKPYRPQELAEQIRQALKGTAT